MENLTLGQISINIAFIVTLLGGGAYLIGEVKKAIHKALQPTNDKIDHLEQKVAEDIKRIDLNSTKNFLVSRLKEIKRGDDVDDVTKMRIFEEYEHYINIGGNSYIVNEVKKYIDEKKL